MAQVADLNAIIVEIAAGAKAQAVGLEEINAAISQMDKMTQQNAAMVEETSGRVAIANAVIRKLRAEQLEIGVLRVRELEVGGRRWPDDHT